MQFPTPDGEPICVASLVRRATVRQLRLHACGCLRLNAPEKTPRQFLKAIEVAERFADGAVGETELEAAHRSAKRSRTSVKSSVDFGFAFYTNDRLRNIWATSVSKNRIFQPDEPDYRHALPRYRVFEELLGPDPLPDFSASWRTSTVLSLAKQMYESREFSAMPILADALQDAGCDDELLLAHCRHATHPHVRGCWVVDLVLDKP